MSKNNVNHIALLGSYVPRQCGIATFTKDVHDALRSTQPDVAMTVLAMDEEGAHHHYPDEVRFQIRAHEESDYRLASQLLNINQVDATVVQHEYGIFGGRDGVLVLNFMRRLRMPVIVTLHTVLEQPTRGQARVMREIAGIADRLVVMSERGGTFLKDIYGVPAHKIAFIPHGIPDVPFADSSFYKDRFGLEGRTVLLTFGLLSPGKGIEYALQALPKVVEQYPDLVYVILGATHPHVLRDEGDAYRNGLERMVDRLGLREHVVFHNRFVAIDELCDYIGAADLYVTPYLNKAQITSGTLAYACGAGKAVVSTPYWYAQEMLGEERGRLVPFGDADAMAEQILDVLRSPVERDAMRKRAYLYGRKMIWSEVGRNYIALAESTIADRRRAPRRVGPGAPSTDTPALPVIDLRHLQTLTDDTGIYQHAVYTIPDRHHGYCTDDNARALVTVMRHFELRRQDAVLGMLNTYLAFLYNAFDYGAGRFRNFMSYDRRWTEPVGSEDSHARALWALGEAVALAPNRGVLGLSTRLFNAALPIVEQFDNVRPWAFALVGVHAYLRRFSGDTHVRRIREVLGERLMKRFAEHAEEDWPWCEATLTYDNGKLPHALLLCGKWLPNEAMTQMGLRALDWLFRVQTHADGYLSLIGCNGWYQQGGSPAVFDQQPLEVMSLVDAAAEAYGQTRDTVWLERIQRSIDWFLGSNVVGVPLYDFNSGGCRDGLNPQGANANQGAESTLSWLMALLTATEIEGRDRTDDEAIDAESREETSEEIMSA